jgi:hypothetical protein
MVPECHRTPPPNASLGAKWTTDRSRPYDALHCPSDGMKVTRLFSAIPSPPAIANLGFHKQKALGQFMVDAILR